MTPLTYVDLRRRSRALLRVGLVLRVVLLLVLFIILGLGLTNLRFITRDLQIEASKLQKSREKLLNNKKILATEVEQLKRAERLRQYAEQALGLSVCAPNRSEKAVVTAQAVSRWDKAALATTKVAPVADDNLLAMVGEKMISWSSVAVAREAAPVKIK